MSSYLAIAVLTACATPSGALNLKDCERFAGSHHGGDFDHTDQGLGQVMWRGFWSFKGEEVRSFDLVDCASGDILSGVIKEEGTFVDMPFDNEDEALRLIKEEGDTSKGRKNLKDVAVALNEKSVRLKLRTSTNETCACAAAYADLRGDKEPFELKDLEL